MPKTMKQCPVSCGRRCSVEFLMCRYCWNMVPKVLREGIYSTSNASPEGQEIRSAGIEYAIKRKRAINIERLRNEQEAD